MINQSITTGNTGKSTLSAKASSSSSPQSSTTQNTLAGIEKGQVIRGEVVDLRSNEVSIKLEDGKIITGKLKDNVSLSIGSKVIFSVEEVSSKTLVLKIVPEMNEAAYTAIDKALDAAGLSKTDRNKDIVNELLNQQMPLDKNTISLILKQSLQFSQVSVDTLVFMHKNHLPVTENTSSFLNGMKNSENLLFHQLNSLTDTLSNQFIEELGDGNPAKTSSTFLQTLLPMKENASPRNVIFQNSAINEFLTYLDTAPDLKNSLPEDFLLPLKMGTATFKEAMQVINTITESFPQSSELLLKEDFNNLSLVKLTKENGQASQSDSIISNPSALEESVNRQTGTSLLTLLTHKERENLVEILRSLTDNQLQSSTEKELLLGESTSRDVLNFIQETLNSPSSHIEDTRPLSDAPLYKLLSSKEFKTILKEELLSEWSLSPEDLKEPEAVKQHFESLLKQLQEIKTFTEQSSLNTSANVLSQVNNLQENLSFMNSLNHLFTYIQLPLKLKNQYSGGELYVYTNKKSAQNKDGGASVLLHLDMNNLGPLDVFLSLQKNHLTSKFYLEKEDVKELVSSNIKALEDVLTKKGYLFQSEFLTREKAVDIMEEYQKNEADLKAKLPGNFDMRA